jgi:hypothetical protein
MSGLTSTESTEYIEKYLKPNDNTTDSEHCSNDTIYSKEKSAELKINLLCYQSTYHSQFKLKKHTQSFVFQFVNVYMKKR